MTPLRAYQPGVKVVCVRVFMICACGALVLRLLSKPCPIALVAESYYRDGCIPHEEIHAGTFVCSFVRVCVLCREFFTNNTQI